MAQDAIISDTTIPVPSRLAKRRNGKSVTPDIGARITGVSIVTARAPLPSVRRLCRSLPQHLSK